MEIERHYFDEEEWEPVTEEEARRGLEGFYLDATPLLCDDLANGETVYTDVAEYRMRRER